MNIFMDSSITVLGTLFKSIQIHTAALVVLVNLELLVEFGQSSLEGWRSRTWFSTRERGRSALEHLRAAY